MTVTGRQATLVTVLLCAAAIVAACGSTGGTASSAAAGAHPCYFGVMISSDRRNSFFC